MRVIHPASGFKAVFDLDIYSIEERFFVSSREFCPAHRRGHWCFDLMAYCASVFACACSVLLFTCLHTYTGYK